MSGEINKPISNCRYPLIVKQLFFSFILLLLCGIARSQTIPNFTIDKKSGCVPLAAVSFTETSTGDVVIRRDWDLGNGIVISNGTTVVSTDYLTAQKFYITLTVTFANGAVAAVSDAIDAKTKEQNRKDRRVKGRFTRGMQEAAQAAAQVAFAVSLQHYCPQVYRKPLLWMNANELQWLQTCNAYGGMVFGIYVLRGQ